MVNRGSFIILASALFLAASIFFNYSAKQNFKSESIRVQQEIKETTHIIDLKKLWHAKGMKSKLNKALSSFNSKKLTIDRKKAILEAKNLNFIQLNRMLNKLASLPLQFKELNINRSGDNFNLECTCVW